MIYLSDIHLEHVAGQELQYLSYLLSSCKEFDVCVLAGDIAYPSQLNKVFDFLSKKFKHVIYVYGNHEYWENGLVSVDPPDNIHVLNNSAITIDGQRYIGSTLWFPFDPLNQLFEKNMPDFNIPDFRSWIYIFASECAAYLKENMQPGDIVVTHHLPSYRCVDKIFQGSQLNRFFVHPMENEILDSNPKLWIHGHTHHSLDITIDDTRVVCNPVGYPGSLNKQFAFKTI